MQLSASRRYLKLGAVLTAGTVLVLITTSLQGWGLQQHLSELHDAELPVAQREVAAQAVWAMFQLDPSLRPELFRQARGMDLWFDLLATESPILTECGGKLLYATLATAGSYQQADSGITMQGARPLSSAELTALAKSLQNPACRDLCRDSIVFTLELDARHEGQLPRLAGIEGLAAPLLVAAGIKPAAISTADPLPEPDWGQAGAQSTAAHLLSNLAAWPAMQSTLLAQLGLVDLLARIIGGMQAVLDPGVPAAAARLVANLAHTNAGAQSLYDEAAGQSTAKGGVLLLDSLLELGHKGSEEERLAASLAIENLAAGSPAASKALLSAGAHVMLLESASGSGTAALQMAAVHAAYNILASQTGWKGLDPVSLPQGRGTGNAASDIIPGVSSSLVPDQLLQALKGALVGMPAERRNGGLLGWGTSLVGGSSEAARGSDWAIMRGLALCGDGAGPQACYSVHHNAAPGLGLHGPGLHEDLEVEASQQGQGSSAGLDRAMTAATVGAGCSMVAAQLLSGSPSLHPDIWGSSADTRGLSGSNAGLAGRGDQEGAGSLLAGNPHSSSLQYLSCYGPEPGTGQERAAWMLSSLPGSSSHGSARIVTGMRDLWKGGSYWSLGSRQAIPATLRAWMLMGSASLTSLWRHQLSPIVTPIFQITYQGGQALVSIITSLLTLLAACLRDAALAVVNALRQTLAGVALLLDLLWQYVVGPLVRLLASFVGAAAVATGGLIGTAALANVAADWLGLGSFVDLLTGRPRQRPMTRF
ncbi:hypothetical protein WJX84_011875 [Apatococcus fuscideae]|uniref:Uncharacterized protein n=1 Tax=Apatococcus fuscideae TaxID=2026836 RepID=A0AAW1SZ80_9CHLO